MEQKVFVHAYETVRPIVLKAFRQYFIQLWDQADMEQEAMMTLYQLLKKFPDLEKDDDKLRRYFKTKFRNRLNDEVRRQESVKRQANRQCYVEISDSLMLFVSSYHRKILLSWIDCWLVNALGEGKR